MGKSIISRWRQVNTVSRAAAARRGTANVEFAMILSLLLFLVLGAVDFGRFATRYIAVTNGARAGAGYAAMNPYTAATEATWSPKLRAAVVDEMQSMFNSQFGNADLQVNYARTQLASSRWRIRVTVSFPFQTVITWPGIPHRITLTRATELPGIR
jgi:Flp pilus assembly protein TadG